MRAFWEQNRANLPRRPPVVSFRQIVVEPRADSVSRAAALALADSLYLELRRGADFSGIAQRFSDDTSTRSTGGALGCFRRGVMVRPFEMTAFSMRPGEISRPVETQYGYHLIRLDRIQTAEVCAHHVLITPAISPGQIADARRVADSIYDALRAGAHFDSLARRYSDPSEQKLAERVPLGELPPEYQDRLNADTSLGLMRPFIMDEGSPRPRFAILQLLERQSAGTMAYEDMKNVIR
jgi:peptidyl-prolyl cis-trans isomerase SurA